jgi:hypothetical protein
MFSCSPKWSAKLLKLSYIMEFQFIGIESLSIINLKYLRVFAHLLHLMSSLTTSHKTDFQFENRISSFQQRVFIANSYCIKEKIETPKEIKSLIESLQNLISFNSKMIPNILSPITSFIPQTIKIINNIKRSEAIIESPFTNPDKPIQIPPFIPFIIQLQAILKNIPDISKIFIKVSLYK